MLHPLQVVSLPRDAPEPALRLFAKVPGVRLLCVGGDGTVGWILSCLDKLADEVRQAAAGAGGLEGDDEGGSRYRWGVEWIPPPVAIMPLGTGNDLARCLGWGTGYSAWRQEGPVGALAEVAQATVALVDRWTLTFTRDALHSAPPTSPLASAGNALQLLSPRVLTSAGSLKLPDVSTKAMNNYFGIGVDAKVALEFHYMREHYPQWFQSQIGNRLVYTGMGALDIMGGGQLDLPFKLRLECDGLEVELPSGAEGVLIVNIPSYMGGVDLWASGNHTGGASAVHGAGSAGEYGAASGYRQSMCDGILELVAVYGSWHLGQLTVGLSGATQLRRARRVVVRTTEELPMQVDGEPFMQPAGEVVVELQSQSRMLRRVASKPVAKVLKAVEEALEAAAEGGVITAAQHNVVSQEVAMRLSS